MKLWQCYAALALAIAATLAAFTYIAGSGRQFSDACRTTSSAPERESCAALGR